jgi:hypothetical protein
MTFQPQGQLVFCVISTTLGVTSLGRIYLIIILSSLLQINLINYNMQVNLNSKVFLQLPNNPKVAPKVGS